MEGARERPFPAGLLEWAGYRSGGVRRPFDSASGRPGGDDVLRTNLLKRLEGWAGKQAQAPATTPRIVLLVGGPGNGKTEAIESTVDWLDRELACAGALRVAAAKAYAEEGGARTPRLVRLATSRLVASRPALVVEIVQDASSRNGLAKPGAHLLVEELVAALGAGVDHLYLACVNRGVLDDALIHALDRGLEREKVLLEAIITAVSLGPDAPACWPLEGFPDVAVWPMDSETLIEPADGEEESAAAKILGLATRKERWPALGTCAAGGACPFCASRSTLAVRQDREALLKILRYYELASGKRWTFRDFFSLTSYLLAGNGEAGGQAGIDPCVWAAELVDQDRRAQAGERPRRQSSSAIFELVAAQYQHALFHRWQDGAAKSVLADAKDLGLLGDNTAMGLHYFLAGRSASGPPSALSPLVGGLVDLLDPALADPGMQASMGSKQYSPGQIQARFSRSVGEGVDYLSDGRLLSRTERDLLGRLAMLDELLDKVAVRRKKPSAAARLQRFVRDFACRLACRSIGARRALLPDADVLEAFQRVVADVGGRGYELREVARHVEDLLNSEQYFEISLTTTFGQPVPPARRRATLFVNRRNVRARELQLDGRPQPPLCYLDVEVGRSRQPVALTYELFKSVRELEGGLSRASLPRAVRALLDTTKARLAGPIVRDQDIVDRARMLVGEDLQIERYRGRFEARKPKGRP